MDLIHIARVFPSFFSDSLRPHSVLFKSFLPLEANFSLFLFLFGPDGDKRDTQQSYPPRKEHLNQVHLQLEIFIRIPHR